MQKIRIQHHLGTMLTHFVPEKMKLSKTNSHEYVNFYFDQSVEGLKLSPCGNEWACAK